MSLKAQKRYYVPFIMRNPKDGGATAIILTDSIITDHVASTYIEPDEIRGFYLKIVADGKEWRSPPYEIHNPKELSNKDFVCMARS